MQKGVVFDIQKYCVHDGPGIRSIVFLKGCNLRCPWCANPESQKCEPELFFDFKKCIGCQACLKICPHGAISISNDQLFYNRGHCRDCCLCSDACYAEARLRKGIWMSVDQVIEEVLKDEVFYNNSGGGVTLSGGEPILQVDFSETFLRECKEKGLHTAVETAGHISWSLIEKIIPYTDLFLYDLKHMDAKIHKEQIGVDNRLILDNLARLSKLEEEIIVRTPIIPGFNYSANELREIARFVAFLGIHELHILPYHNFGSGKYRLLGREYLYQEWREPEKHVIGALKDIAASEGLKVIVGG